jgi:triosephosphate isomerase
MVNHKVASAIAAGLRPIFCVGETLAQRESGRASEVISQQIRGGLSGLNDVPGLVVAYEPVWAIGTGQAATPEIADEIMGGVILPALEELLGRTMAQDTPLLYGGSVNPGNIESFAQQDSVSGALVGGASLDASQFADIVRLTASAKRVG